MPPKSWMIQVFLVGFLLVCPVDFSTLNLLARAQSKQKIIKGLKEKEKIYVVADNFYGQITADKHFQAKLEGMGYKNSTVVCKGATAKLHCGEGEVIYVSRATYGRSNKETCSESIPVTELQNITCSLDATSTVVDRCARKQGCDFEVDNTAFSDPCKETYKYLEVKYSCQDLDNLTETAPCPLKLLINTTVTDTGKNHSLLFLQKNATRQKKLWKDWPQVEEKTKELLLYIPKNLVKIEMTIHVLGGKHCFNSTESFKYGIVNPRIECNKEPRVFNQKYCANQVYNDKYIINITASPIVCINCDNPVKTADEELQVNTTFESEGEEIEASKAVELMSGMGNLISKMNGTSAELSVGKGIEGVIVRKTNPDEMEEVSFAYQDPNDRIKIIENRSYLEGFSRSISVPKEAFEKAVNSNITFPFAAVLRFMNLSQDENNSTVLNHEVVAIEMGTEIKNLTDTISINFKIRNELTFNKLQKEYQPICRSWDGEGGKPNWTVEGCKTIIEEDGIRCKCSHLTFFAVLLTPINQNISSSDLNTLTIITQVGCGFSIFFLGIVLFMYFLIRKTKASTSTQILIHLICSLLLLNLTFVVNHFVADMNSVVGCVVMAAVMHYCMLATFSWFAAQGFHLCLQLYRRGNITAKRYVLKVSVFTWILPCILVITLVSLKKYGKQTIYTDDPQNNVAMCWITDNNIHYIVNIGYYSLVFLFTFTTVIITLSWLCCMKKTKAASPKENGSGISIVIVMGLCFQLGVTWGFAFFAYGSFRMIATYIFTVLNSFQGFFLFIYYCKTARVTPNAANEKGNSSSISTLKSGLENIVNPYVSSEKGM